MMIAIAYLGRADHVTDPRCSQAAQRLLTSHGLLNSAARGVSFRNHNLRRFSFIIWPQLSSS
jgi:hypothetical protein